MRASSPARVRVALALKAAALRCRAGNPPARILGIGVSAVYRAYAVGFLGMDIPVSTRIASDVRIYHSVGLVVNDSAIISSGVVLRGNTTIAARHRDDDAPILEEDVEVGANVVIMGEITVGRGAIIGAGSVVLKDVPPGEVVAGNPARAIRPARHRKNSAS